MTCKSLGCLSPGKCEDPSPPDHRDYISQLLFGDSLDVLFVNKSIARGDKADCTEAGINLREAMAATALPEGRMTTDEDGGQPSESVSGLAPI